MKEIKSILRKEIDLLGSRTFEENKDSLIKVITNSKIKDMDKKRLKLEIFQSKNNERLTKYIWNALLKYEGQGVI